MSKKGIVIKKDIYSGIKGKLIIILMNQIHRYVHKWLVKKMDIKQNDRVLDIGCGGGTLLALMAEKTNEKVCGIDYSSDMVLAAVKKNRKSVSSGHVEVIKASVSQMPFSNDLFSVITSFETIQFWPDISNDILEVKRVLKEGGKFYIMNRLPEEGSKWYDFSQFRVPDDYRTALEKAGFSNIIIDTTSRKGWIFITASK